MKRFSGWRLAIIGACLATQGLIASQAHSTENVTFAEEFARKVTAAQSIAPLGNDLFGDQTDWYTGQTTFTVVDVDLPGNNALPVRITRTRSTAPPEGHLTRDLLGDWDLDVPYMSGVFRKNSLWVPTNRCTTNQVGPPNTSNGSASFTGTEYSRGNFINIPGYGKTHVLWPDPAYTIRPQNGQTYRWVTASNIQLRCLTALASGQSGEGFEAITPDGVRYTFNWMATLPYSKYSRRKVLGTGFDILDREEVRIYATRVEDRFGNYVNYSYTGALLTKIESSDGRVINLSYNAQNKISAITAHGRTWTYGYSNGYLSTVTLPDGSQWGYSTSSLLIIYYSQPSAPSPCHLPPLSALSSSTINMGNQGWTMTHPSGATAVFRFALVRHLRTNITLAQSCRYINGEGYDRFGVAAEFDTMALVSKTLSGPNLAATSWTASYGATSNHKKVVVNTNPDGSVIRHTFGTEFYRNEGKSLRVEVLATGGAVVSDTQTSYAIAPSSPAYAYRVGRTGSQFEDAFNSTIVTAVTSTSITQNGTTFTTSTPVASLDALARPLSVAKSNTAGATRTDAIAYHDDLVRWTLGQVKSVTNLNTGLVESSTDFYASTALPHKTYSFGLLQQTFNYNANGTLASVVDGLNRTTTLSSWKRGVPRSIGFPGGASMSAVVNDHGWITAITDERGHKTDYGYDAMGRVSSVTYPASDTVSWTAKSIGYARLAGSELGIPAGSWRRNEVHGRFRHRTYYDAMFRPVLVEEADTTSGVKVYRKNAYDYEGRQIFQSYPSATTATSEGIHSSYDAIGRLTGTRTHNNITLSTLAYPSGIQTRITDADNRVTTITYQAFGEPSRDRPTRIDAPENQTTVINRDVFGKLTSVTQSGTWTGGSVSATRSFVYDSFQRPCRRIDPESGSTVWGYDAASQVLWEARGQSGSGCPTTAPIGATHFAYDPRGRKVFDNHPGTADDVNYGFDAAGNLTSVSTPTATWTYTYNKRNLLETEQAVVDGKTLLLDPVYNGLGHVASLVTPGQTIAYAPDAWGRPTQLGTWATGIQYHPNGVPSGFTYGNGLVFSQSLDVRRRPQLQEVKNGAAWIQKLQYGYTNGGDVTAITDQVNGADSVTMTYDSLHRLKSASGLWGSYSYVYDPLNNIRSRSGPNALTYTYNATSNRLTGISGSQTRTYGYNARGEITGDGTKSFTLNSLGQIQSITGIATYGYDGHGRRIKVTKSGATEYTLYDRAGRLVYTELGTTKTDYLSVGGHTVVELRKTGTTTTPTYLHPDLLGSPRKATTQAKALLWSEHYDPYGLKLNGVNQKIGYTGHAHDAESGYTYMQARFYDPLVGRFLSTDPIHFVDENPFTFNRYSYANNNPYRYTDPNGEAAQVIYAAAGGTIVCGPPCGAAAAVTAWIASSYATEKLADWVFSESSQQVGEGTTSGIADAKGRVTGNAVPDRVTSKGTRIFESPPTGEGPDDILNDVKKLPGAQSETKNTIRGPADVVTLPDGSRVIDRNSKQGDRTIEIQNENGRTTDEVRFPNDELKR